MHKPKHVRYELHIADDKRGIETLIYKQHELLDEYNNLVEVVNCMLDAMEESCKYKIFFKDK